MLVETMWTAQTEMRHVTRPLSLLTTAGSGDLEAVERDGGRKQNMSLLMCHSRKAHEQKSRVGVKWLVRSESDDEEQRTVG